MISEMLFTKAIKESLFYLQHLQVHQIFHNKDNLVSGEGLNG